jgi:hypothetical protein
MWKTVFFVIMVLGFVIFFAACNMLNLSKTDQATLDSLRDAGSDFSKVHPFDFYLYHENKAGAQRICAELELDGFQVSVTEGAIQGEWLCLARLSFLPSVEKLSELSRVFEELINAHGGEYDGWETIVISE